MDLVICIVQGCLNSRCSENKLKPLGTILKFLGRTEEKHNRPSRSPQSLVPFPCLWEQGGDLHWLHSGLPKREGLAGRVQEISPTPLHLSIAPPPELWLLAPRGGKQNSSSTAWVAAPMRAWRGAGAQAGHWAWPLSAGGLAGDVSSLLLLSTGSAQTGPALNCSPSREANADF